MMMTTMFDILLTWFKEDRVAYAIASLILTLVVGAALSFLFHSLARLLETLGRR